MTANHLSVLDSLAIPANAKALITQEVASGLNVIVPSSTVMISGQPAIAWYTVNPTTGETIGVGENGSHAAVIDYAGAIVGVAFLIGLLPRIKVHIHAEPPPTPQTPTLPWYAGPFVQLYAGSHGPTIGSLSSAFFGAKNVVGFFQNAVTCFVLFAIGFLAGAVVGEALKKILPPPPFYRSEP